MKKLFFLSFLLTVVCGYSKTVQFTILTFNDVYDIHPKHTGIGGFSPMQSLLERERAKAKHHITTMNGDFLFPSVLSTFDKGKHRVELFNEMDVDLVVLGNHEFDFGPSVVKDRISESNFPWFGANVYDLDGNYFTGEKQTHIVEVDGVKIGFFGVVTNETPVISSTNNSVLFCPLAFTAKQMCNQLRAQGVDVIVALTHLFVSEDRKLAKEVDEIDVILGGHDHDPVVWYEKGTLIMKCGQNAYFLGRIDLDIEVEDRPEGKCVHVFPSWDVIINRGAEKSEKIQKLIDGYDKQFDEMIRRPIATVCTSLDSRHAVIRGKESTMANLILDALREETGADCAMMSGGIIRGDRYYPSGSEITYGDVLKELAFDNINVVVEVMGKDILKALETGLSQCEHLSGKFPQVSGMEVFFNENNPPGERIIDVKIQGEPIILRKKYTLATNTYNQEGGDGYFSLCNGRIVRSPEDAGKLVQTFVKYLEKNPDVSILPENRIRSFNTLGS